MYTRIEKRASYGDFFGYPVQKMVEIDSYAMVRQVGINSGFLVTYGTL